jgi:RNA 2',3'-cyclic 3'-phosphodiesterase
MRLFIALKPDPPAGEKLAGFADSCGRIRDVRWTRPENLHLTLLFLGELEEAAAGLVRENVSAAAAGFRVFSFSLDIRGLFRKGAGSVLWAGCSDSPELVRLAGRIREALAGYGDEKPFKAHLTVGRSRRKVDEKAWQGIPYSPVEYAVRGIQLIKSELFPEGPRYTVLSEALFKE